MLDKFLRDHGVQANFIRMHHNPDPNFPNGIPNPLLLVIGKLQLMLLLKKMLILVLLLMETLTGVYLIIWVIIFK